MTDYDLIVSRLLAHDVWIGDGHESDDEIPHRAASAIKTLMAENARLRDVIVDALDDMRDAKCVCSLTKAHMRHTLGPETQHTDIWFSYAQALDVIIKCDEAHGKPSPLRAARAALGDA